MHNNTFNIITLKWFGYYEKYPFLLSYKEILWENIRVVWEWNNAIIIEDPKDKEQAIKISKWWKSDNLKNEVISHKKFFDTLEKWLEDYPEDLSKNVKIPLTINSTLSEDILRMEKIKWQTIATKFYIEFYNKDLTKYWDKYINSISDYEFNILLDSENLRRVPVFTLENDFEWKTIGRALKFYFKEKIYWTELWNTLDFLEWKWLTHDDLHPWNIMIDMNWNYFIIDFWRVKIKNLLDENKNSISRKITSIL